MHTHTTHFRVRYALTDQMGYLYYGHYAMLYEVGRTEMLRDLGLTYAEMESQQGVMMPVMSMDMRFVRPARYDELLKIQTELLELPGQTISFRMRVYNEADELVNGGRVKLCFVDMKTQERVNAPANLVEKLKPYFE
ncbi:MAG: thioesterase family protein [Bacteroidota bacterium]